MFIALGGSHTHLKPPVVAEMCRLQVQQAQEQASGAEVSSLRTRLDQATAASEAWRAKAGENDTLRAKLTDLEASAQHAWQWQEAYSQLQRQLHDAQVGAALPRQARAGVRLDQHV